MTSKKSVSPADKQPLSPADWQLDKQSGRQPDKQPSRQPSKRADYHRIKRKLYLQMLIALAAAFVGVVLLWLFIQQLGIFGDGIVGFLERSFHLSHEDAMRVYQYIFRNNVEVFIAVAVVICFFLLCRGILSNFMHYFDEANNGVDALIKGDVEQIELSDEMAFFEQKLSTLKQALEKREQDAKLAEQRKNDLVMYLAHDIKTPLTSVIGYLSLLDEAPDMPVEQRAKYLHITLDKAYRLEQLIDEFFEITRFNLQTVVLDKGRIDLYYMLVQLAEEWYPQLAASGKQVVIKAAEDLTVYGDADKLARVFNNILKNAAAYSQDNSAIEIVASLSGGVASITFSNSGSIPKDKLASIFEKFYRLDGSRSSDTGGAGLGLAIAKEIVVQHGGRIYAESDDEQTAFIVELPATPQPLP